LRLEHLDDVARVIRPLMAGFAAPWCVAGGWALDLFLGRMTRPHADVELAVFRRDQGLLHGQFRGWTLEKFVDGQRQAWGEAERLELPVHEIHGRPSDGPPGPIEFLLNERDGANWVFRRDPRIVLPLDRVIVDSASGVAALAPEIVLLFKAKSLRAKDECDFHAALAALGNDRRQWLRAALEVCHPNHPWTGLMGGFQAG
jgi:hypothetical protein